jgi:nucleoside-triphosphatase THEP1
MQRRLFLCGPSGCGKTTMIRSALGGALAGAGGFVTERIGAPDGSLRGFELLPSAAAAGVAGFTGARFLDYTCDPPAKDNEVFRVEGVRLLTEAQYYPFALLDEIGGFELVIPQFRAQLGVFLSSSVPCVGVLKAPAGVDELRERFGLGEKYPALWRRLRESLEGDPDTLLIDTSGRGDERAERALREWAALYAR